MMHSDARGGIARDLACLPDSRWHAEQWILESAAYVGAAPRVPDLTGQFFVSADGTSNLLTRDSSTRPMLDDCLTTHSAVLPRAADACTARMMRRPNRARLTSDAAVLLT